MNFTLESMIEALNTLTVGAVYKYASAGRPTTGTCVLVSVDSNTGAIQYKRSSNGDITSETPVNRITGENVAKLASALNSRKAVEINALYGGSGNFRSVLEALVANTANVFLCQIDGKKHIFWNPDNSHAVGQITIAEAPEVYVVSPEQLKSRVVFDTCSRQLITYGAPGTGKSFRIKAETAKAVVFRTTFHPDSDYASFVGAYKPIMKHVERTALVGKKLEMADVESVKEELKKEKVISYEFVDQVFTQAYIKAWEYQKVTKDGETPKRVYLVIEEINRGNCAQVFGDLFQLLDRNESGFSDYPIKPDSDFGRHIGESLSKADGTFNDARKKSINALYPDAEDGVNVVDAVMAGNLMLFPDNLFIRATMNTSDQSLFPMDSAFKRRWDWDYVAITDHPEEEWEIEIDATTHYRWWDFLDAINKEIFKATSSEDKRLGYFFVRAHDKKIDLNMFVNKVVFYLWNSVFKDCYTDCEFIKQGADDYFTFTSFFKNGKPDAERAKAFLKKLPLKPKNDQPPVNDAEAPGETTDAPDATGAQETTAENA